MDVLFERIPAHHPQVISRMIEEETLLLKVDTGQVSVLNEVGGSIWALMDGKRRLADIVEQLGQTYRVERQQLESDVQVFVHELLDRDMLAWS